MRLLCLPFRPRLHFSEFLPWTMVIRPPSSPLQPLPPFHSFLLHVSFALQFSMGSPQSPRSQGMTKSIVSIPARPCRHLGTFRRRNRMKRRETPPRRGCCARLSKLFERAAGTGVDRTPTWRRDKKQVG